MSGPAQEQHRRRRWPWVVLALAVVVIVVVAAAAFLVLRSSEDQEAALAGLEATSVDESTLPASLPFRHLGGHISVDVLADDADEPIDFLLDSGAPTTYSDEVAETYAGEALGNIVEVAIDGSTLTVPVVPIETLAMGGAVFQDAAGTQGFIDADNPLSCLGENGLIGASLMKEAVWQIDYAAEDIVIAPSLDGLDHIDGAIALDFTSDSSNSPSPLLRFGADDGELVFLLDTGSDGGLTVNPADLEAIGISVDPEGPTIESIGAGLAGTYETALAFASVDLDIGGTALDGYPVATIDLLAAGQGNIGNAFLDDFVVTIDWPGGVVYLDPVAADRSVPTPLDPAAATLSWDGEDIIIGSVARGSTVAEAGLKLGDTVTAVGDVDYGDATRDDFCALSTSDTPDRYSVTTADGESYEIGPADGFYDSLDR